MQLIQCTVGYTFQTIQQKYTLDRENKQWLSLEKHSHCQGKVNIVATNNKKA